MGVDDKALGQQDPWQTGVDVLGAIMIPFAKMRVGVLFGEKKTLGKNDGKLDYGVSLLMFVSYIVDLLRTRPVGRRG